jgi:pimeloyl-ACP methyl ester carboxylesterase
MMYSFPSQTRAFDAAAFARTSRSFANPDFVDVCIHSYRHRHGNAAGDPRYADIESRLAKVPTIGVPTIAPHGADDDVNAPAGSAGHAKHFTGPYERRVLAGVGHNPPHEAPAAFAAAILDVQQL